MKIFSPLLYIYDMVIHWYLWLMSILQAFVVKNNMCYVVKKPPSKQVIICL